MPRFEKVPREEVVGWWAEHFGVPPEAFTDLSFFRRGKKTVFMVRSGLIEGIPYDTVGITIMRASTIGPCGWRPTTAGIRALARHITADRCVLTREQAVLFIRGTPLTLNDPGPRRYVLATYQEQALGCGLVSGEQLIPQISRDRRIRDVDLP